MGTGILIACALAGAAWGAWLPALVDRYAVPWPAGAPRPPWRGYCTRCGAARAPLVPGCRCGYRPAVPVPLCAALFLAVGAGLGPAADLPAYLALAALGSLLSIVDILVHRLPDPLLRLAAGTAVVLLGLAALGEHRPDRLLRAALAVPVCAAWYLLPAVLPGRPAGAGDAKLGAVLGLYLGWRGWPATAVGLGLAPLLAAPAALGAALARGRRARIAYGPAMLLAAALVVLGPLPELWPLPEWRP